ncbi:MAG TPA: single-stranded-DNA-specific exonuclease RecJ [Puia sp.]|nr:single-stranded-DNA-specific exonuclease RecJ [Puia sp.]
MQKTWKILPADNSKISALRDALKISPVLCRLLVNRGIETFDEAKQYFRPELTGLHDPWLMKDMDKAVSRIDAALTRKEKILVYGDYDVDGTASVACLFQFLQKFYLPELIDFYIPHREREGYGVSKMGIDFAKENGFTLIISLDCGIKSAELIYYAKELEIDFIVCDHHLPDSNLPQAAAILNPKQPGCHYPYKDLCGCGVGFKLMTALAQRFGIPEQEVFLYLDLVATAIAADIVPLTGENRILAFHGLKKVNENPNNGIMALMQLSGLQKEMHIHNLVFMIAPRVNAAGRMDDAKKAVEMFVAKSYEEALSYGRMLQADNIDRKEADLNITEEALAIIQNDEILMNRKSTVVFQPHWHKGVVGIVASRLIEKYYRPTVVLTRSGDIIAGSARSINGFNLYEAIHACREHLLGYGGHFAAAGMTLLPEKVELFSAKFEEIVSSTLEPGLLIPEILIDAEVEFKDLNASFYKILRQMEPFGPENPRPVFIAGNVEDSGHSKVVKDQHIRFSLKQGNQVFNGIGFNMADKYRILEQKMPIDLLFTLDENEWNDQKNLQLKVMDLRLSGPSI